MLVFLTSVTLSCYNCQPVQNLRLSQTFTLQTPAALFFLLEMASNDSKLDETDDDENLFSSSTQENEEIDVTWDWNSPHSKRNQNIAKKKRIRDTALHSPKLTLKRHASNNQMPVFDKIKEQMVELRNQVINSANHKNLFGETVFDDSIEQELVLCSQKVEAQIECLQQQNHEVVKEKLADDSFDLILEQLDDEKIEQLSQPVKVEKSAPPVNSERVERLTDAVIVSDGEVSPVKCSPEEIEQKRLQALEKLQAKKKQQIIERNRQEALRRLEKNKKKLALPRKLSVALK